MRGFQHRLGEFQSRGIRVLAISTDAPEVNREHREKHGFTFTFLSDASSEAIKQYDLLHQEGGPGGAAIARPAEFLIDPSGTVRWVNLTDNVMARARPEQVLRVFDDLKL